MSVRALPSQEVTEPELKAKKDALKGLTVAKLASYDDFLTDALVDRVYFWSTIRKNRARYSSSRYLKDEEIAKILQNRVVIEKDAQKAVEEIMTLSGVKRYLEKLSAPDREHFQAHMLKYVNTYLPDCPFEVSTTNRYTIDTQEAAIVARKFIRKGDPIKYLVGVQIQITKDEEKDLDLTRRDFSIIMAGKSKKLPSLFLGPARFANHDCNHNARLVRKGLTGMAVHAKEDIPPGQEVVVSYGDDYFGEDNNECLCATCENKLRNGWDPQKRDEESDAEAGEEEEDSSMLSNRSRAISGSASSSGTRTPDGEINPGLKRKRGRPPKSGNSTPRSEPRLELVRQSSSFTFKHSPSRLRQELRLDSEEQQAHGGLLDPLHGTLTPERSGSPPSIFDRQTGSGSSTAATSLSNQQPESTIKPRPAPIVINDEEPVTTASIWSMPYSATMIQGSVESPASSQLSSHISSQMSSQVDCRGSESELSDLDDKMAIDDETKQVVARKKEQRQSRRVRDAKYSTLRRDSSSSTPVIDPNDYDNPNARRRGDYTLTRRLLSKPDSKWNWCRVCNEYFVQFEAHQTRWSCPRCERHSKLYGYVWPKTDKLNKDDTEERILDHREIVRFVHGEEERFLKKGKKNTESLRARKERRERGGNISDEEVNYGANPRLLEEEEWSTDEDEVPVRGKRGHTRKPQKRDYNLDGSLREKRPYTWSGKYVGRWNKRHAPSDNRKFGGVHPATATAKKAATDSANGSPEMMKKSHKKMVNGAGVQKRPYVRSGKYIGRLLKRQLVQEGKLPKGKGVYKNSALPYGTENSASTAPPTPSKEPKKKQPWKGWALVDQEGNVVSPPDTPTGKVAKARRFHPEVVDKVRLDVKPEHLVNPKKPRRKSSNETPAADSSTIQLSNRGDLQAKAQLSTAQQSRPKIKRVKGWAYYDENGALIPPTPRKNARARNVKQEIEVIDDSDHDDEPAESSPALLDRFRPRIPINLHPLTGAGSYRRVSTGTLTAPTRRIGVRKNYVLPDTDESEEESDEESDDEDEETDSEEETSDEDEEEDEDEPPHKKRKYVRTGRYNGRKAAQVARREAQIARRMAQIDRIEAHEAKMADVKIKIENVSDEEDNSEPVITMSSRKARMMAVAAMEEAMAWKGRVRKGGRQTL